MDFLLSLSRSFLYPFRGHGKIHFIISAFLCVVFYFTLIIDSRAMAILGGYFIAYCTKMVQESAMGNEEVPDYPGVNNWVEDIWWPYIRFVLVSFLYICIPLYLLFADWAEEGRMFSQVYLVLGMIIFPIAFMRMTILDSIKGLEPIGCVKSIINMGIGGYTLLVIIFYLLAVTPYLLIVLNESESVLLGIFQVMFSFYTLSVLMNVMGKFYMRYEDNFWEEDE